MAGVFKRFLREEAGLSRWEVWQYHRAERYNWHELKREVKRLVRPARRLLELGAGGGGFTKYLLREMLRPAQRILSVDRRIQDQVRKLAEAYPVRLEVLEADICRLPDRCRGFDLVVTHHTLHDLEMDRTTPAEVFAALAACLAPGGRLLLIDKVMNGMADANGEILAERLHVDLGRLRETTIFGLHDLEDYVHLAHGAGLVVTRCALIGQDPGPRPNAVRAAFLRAERDHLAGRCPVERRREAEELIARAIAEIMSAPAGALSVGLIAARRGRQDR